MEKKAEVKSVTVSTQDRMRESIRGSERELVHPLGYCCCSNNSLAAAEAPVGLQLCCPLRQSCNNWHSCCTACQQCEQRVRFEIISILMTSDKNTVQDNGWMGRKVVNNMNWGFRSSTEPEFRLKTCLLIIAHRINNFPINSEKPTLGKCVK